jgi:hypothetical protein
LERAAADRVITVAEKRRVELGTHTNLWDYVSRLDSDHPRWNMSPDFSYMWNLHQNFYDDWLPEAYVKDGVEIGRSLMKNLRTLL